MRSPISQNIRPQHMSAKSVLASRKAQRKQDALALAEVIYDIFKEKKQRERSIIDSGQNNAKQPSRN